MTGVFNNIATALTLSVIFACGPVFLHAQEKTPLPAGKGTTTEDSTIIFESPRPLVDVSAHDLMSRPNSWGFTFSITDYGFGGGLYYKYSFDPMLAAGVNLDIGGAKTSKEFGFTDEIKIHRIYVMPLMANIQVRVLANSLTEGFRPYITAGAGPVFVMFNDGQQEFFSALFKPTFDMTFGSFLGIGANFGTDAKTLFGANIRYFIIPYAKGVESTRDHFLTNFSGVSLSVNYGFTW
jgi:outer membrane protein W